MNIAEKILNKHTTSYYVVGNNTQLPKVINAMKEFAELFAQWYGNMLMEGKIFFVEKAMEEYLKLKDEG